MYKQLVLRPHVKATCALHDLIARSHCWHFDARMYRGSQGALYLTVETRAGGREMVASHVYNITWHGSTVGLRACAALPETAREITLQDRAEALLYSDLNVVHQRYVLPMVARRPATFRSSSVALHYVRAPSLDPLEGAGGNFHVYERRA